MQYPMVDLTPFDEAGVEYEYVDVAEFGEGTMSNSMVPASNLENFDALILLAASFTKDSVPLSGRLACVARFGVGFDNVDVDACTAAGIAATITPDGVRRPVAVTVVNFMLTLASRMFAKDRLARQGTDGWAVRSQYMGVGVTGKTLGLLGLGNIGAEICRLVEPRAPPADRGQGGQGFFDPLEYFLTTLHTGLIVPFGGDPRSVFTITLTPLTP
jgi:phosphoglycerate dehydrogenase-like enzyme